MRLDAVQVISFFIGCTLYGIVLSTIIPCTRVLLFNLRPSSDNLFRVYSLKRKREIKFPILVTVWLAFIVATVDNAIWLPQMFHAFVYGRPGGAIEYFEQLSVWPGLTMSLIDEALSICIGDAVLIYRCYVIYEWAWQVTILPSVLFLGSAVCAGLAASKAAVRLPVGPLTSDASISPFITAALALTVATNIITTGLIVYRLWTTESRLSLYRLNHEGNRNGASPHTLIRRAIKIVLESGSVYTTLACVTLVLHVAHSNLQYIAACAIVQVVPINFNLIVIRSERTSQLTVCSACAVALDAIELQANISPINHRGSHQLRSARSSRSQTQVAFDLSSETIDEMANKQTLEVD